MPRQIQSAVVNLGSMDDFRREYMERLDMSLAIQGKYTPILDK